MSSPKAKTRRRRSSSTPAKKAGLLFQNREESKGRYDMYVGIDPGLSGAIAVINGDNTLTEVFFSEGATVVYDMPVLSDGKQKSVDPFELAQFFNKIHAETVWGKNVVVCVEKPITNPKFVSKNFAFGLNYGVVLGALGSLNWVVDLVLPKHWMRPMGVRGKEGSLSIARRLFPSLRSKLSAKCHDGRADALLLAEYARIKHG